MTSRQLQLAWWVVLWGLVASLSVNAVLPAFDHHAGEYSPFHGHAVLGAISPSDRDQVLAAHPHGAGQPHSHGATAPRLAARVVAQDEGARTVIGTSQATDLLALEAGVVHVIVASDWPLPTSVQAIWLTLLPAALQLQRRTLPPPESPPRFQ